MVLQRKVKDISYDICYAIQYYRLSIQNDLARESTLLALSLVDDTSEGMTPLYSRPRPPHSMLQYLLVLMQVLLVL